MKPHVLSYLILYLSFLITQTITSQQTNTAVIAKIKTEASVNDLITVKGTAANTENDIKSLRYELFVIKTNLQNNNISRNKQSGRFVINPYESKELSTTTINQNTRDKVTILLFIYDIDDKLVGKDRKVVVNNDEKKENTSQVKGSDRENDGIALSGIVTDNTRTKSGRDFYRAFYAEYLLSQVNIKQIINIEERLSLGRNTDIVISIDGKEINRFRAQPRPDFIKQMVVNTFQLVFQYVQNLETQKKQITQY